MDRVRSHGIDSRVAPANTTRPEVDTRQQIVHLCGELAGRDETTLNVALDGINNNLTKIENLDETDKVAIMVEECGSSSFSITSDQIHHKCLSIMERFFPEQENISQDWSLGCV